MDQIKPRFSSLLFILFLLLPTATTTTSFSYFQSYSQYKTLLSLSHSLIIRVSNLRAARGDVAGANRAKLIAEKLERALRLGFFGVAWSGVRVGWDYAKNHAWRDLDHRELNGVVSDLNELAHFLGELTRSNSDTERIAWVARNYGRVLRVAKSVAQRLVSVFRQSEPLKAVVETVQMEVVEGDLLRDCLELGSNDLKGLVQIIKDLASQYYSTSHYDSDL